MRILFPLMLAGLASACTLPPVTTAQQSFSVKYSNFVPGAAQGLPFVTGLPAFSDQTVPSLTVPVPKEARTFKLATLDLLLQMSNTGPLPLRIKIFLDKTTKSDADLYAGPPLGGAQGEIDLPRGGQEVDKDLPIDPSLVLEDNLKIGYSFGSPGTSESATFKDTDQVNVNYSIKAAAKLF